MKYLIINVVCGIRSTGRICTDIADSLEKQGHEVRIAYGREMVPLEAQKYAVQIGNNFDVAIHGIRARLLDQCGFGSTSATMRFIEWVKTYDPDVIHLHNLHGYYINIEILFNYLRTSGKRIIWTLHDCWAFTGHSALCDAISCERWKDGCFKCPQLHEYPKSFIDRSRHNWERKKKLFSGIPNLTIVTPSAWLGDMVGESFLNQYDRRVIHNGIDTNIFFRRNSSFKDRLQIDNKKVVLGVASTWSEMKGLKDFYELSKLLDNEYQIVLVGLSERQIADLPDSIIGLQRTNNPMELAEIYSSSYVLLNLSKTENFPTIILEAAACGTPCISYDVGGSREIASVVVPKDDYRAVATALNNLNKSELVTYSKEECVKEYMGLMQI